MSDHATPTDERKGYDADLEAARARLREYAGYVDHRLTLADAAGLLLATAAEMLAESMGRDNARRWVADQLLGRLGGADEANDDALDSHDIEAEWPAPEGEVG